MRKLVLDYAETRREQVGTLLRALAASGVQTPIRVVLLVRQPANDRGRGGDPSAKWVAAVRPYGDEVADQLLDQARVVVLNDEPLAVDERRELFSRAVTAYRRTERSPQLEPVDMTSTLYEQPLMVVMAGYLTAHGGQQPTTSTGMFEAILAHESRYWQATARTALVDLSDQELAELVAVATLTDVVDQAEADQVLRLLPSHRDASLRDLRRASALLSRLYNPGDDRAGWLPLVPDQLGEYLVASRLPNLAEILDWSLQASRKDDQLIRPLTVLARGAASHAAIHDAGVAALRSHVGSLVELAVARATDPGRYGVLASRFPDALAGAVRLFGTAIGDRALRDAWGRLPDRNHLLAPLAVSVTTALVDRYRELANPTSGNPSRYRPVLADFLNDLGIGLSELGRRDEALAPAQEAVDIYRELTGPTSGTPSGYRPDLASALNNLGARLSELGRRDEALAPIEEAVNIYRELADPTTGNPAAHRRDLASALNNLGALLSELGRRDEALAPAQEAVDINRELADPTTGNPAAHRPELAMTLNNLGLLLSKLGRRDEALAYTQEAVDIRRELADPDTGNPTAYRPDLATALHNLGIRLSRLGRPDEALAYTQEAVDIRRELADPDTGNPAAHQHSLANSLWAIGWICENNRHDRDRGLTAVNESVELFEQLVRASGTIHVARLEAASRTREALLRLKSVAAGE